MKLKNKTILLTGATGGIGSQTAMLLAKQGARLVLVGRDCVALEELKASLLTAGPEQVHITVSADLNMSQERLKLVQSIPVIDVLVNLAGVNQLAMLTQMNDQQISRIIESNLTTPIQLCKDLIPGLIKQPEATIVNVGSILGSIGMPGSSVYCASKFGLHGFTESLRRELSDTTVNVLYIAPRATQTAMNDEYANALNLELGNSVDSPQRVAEIIVKALNNSKNNSRYLGWPEKLFVRINSVLPGLVDGSLKKQLPIIQRHTQSQMDAQVQINKQVTQ